MQHTFKRTISVSVLAALSITLTPSISFAQYQRQYDGGDTNYGYFARSESNSAMRDAIDDLDEDAVEDLPIPVLFGVAVKNLTKNFGDARSGHAHQGLDIMAAEGMPVVSPTDAVVVQTGTGESSGNFVTTANPGGESYVYMHLSKIADIERGDVLEKGDLIGFVGHTGNAVATAPHLHFELHDEDGIAVDPFPRLTGTFDPDDKMEYLDQIFDDIDDNTDEDMLAELIVAKARAEVVAAVADDEAPDVLAAALKRAAVAAPATTSSTGSSGSTSTSTVLKVGSRGAAVMDLQTFLVKKNVGSASKVKPDGAFGPITRQAVIDYQASAGLTADGVAGPKTLAYMAAHQ